LYNFPSAHIISKNKLGGDDKALKGLGQTNEYYKIR
jgi:hypothetical protein